MRHALFHHLGGGHGGGLHHLGGGHIGDFLRLAGIVLLMVLLLALLLEFLGAVHARPEERRAQTGRDWILYHLAPIAIAAGALAWLIWGLSGHSR